MRAHSLVLLITLLLLYGAAFASNRTESTHDDFCPRWRDIDFEYSVTYDDYIANCRRFDTEIRSVLSFPLALGAGEESEGRVAILVNSELYPQIQDDLIVWVQDMNNDGFEALLVEATFEMVEDLRAALRWAWESEEGLVGCILVGDFPVAWYEISGFGDYDLPGYPFDVYFEDLNGDFGDADENGVFDSHTNGDGDEAPEIWIGRLLASDMTEAEDVLVRRYLQKNHRYRTGEITAPHRALLFLDDDFKDLAPQLEDDLSWQYDYILTKTEPCRTNAEEYLRRLEEGFEWVFPIVHSNYYGHYFYYRDSYSDLTSNDIARAPLNSLFYLIQACSNSRYVERNYMGGWYIFGESSLGLHVIGMTRPSNAYYVDELHRLLSEGLCIGEAWREWQASIAPYWVAETFAYSCQTKLGDPTLRPLDMSPPKPPKNFRSRPTDEEDAKVIFWDASHAHDIAGYRLYYDTSGGYPPYKGRGLPQGASPIDVGLATSITVTHEDPYKLDEYNWAVTAYDNLGNESDYSEALDSCGDPALNPPVIDWVHFEKSLSISYEEGGEFQIRAHIGDDEDGRDLPNVELLLNGQHTGVMLQDDGTYAIYDPHGNDYVLKTDIPAGLLDPGQYLISIIATDRDGNTSDEWPYLTIPGTSATQKGIVASSSRSSFPDIGNGKATGWDGEEAPSVASIRMCREPDAGADCWLIAALVSHSEGREYVKNIQLYFDHLPIGIYLARRTEKDTLGKAYYEALIDSDAYGLQPGKYLLGIVATDVHGNESDMFPYLYVE